MFSERKSGLVIAIVLTSIVVLISVNRGPAVAQNIDMSNWMRDMNGVIGNRSLSKIAMPGTHDSAMYKGMPDGDAAKNQNKDLTGQLNAGSRAFDFRIGYIWDGCSAFPNSFSDPRVGTSNGPECWKCPPGYRRSTSAVTASNACVMADRVDYKPVTRHGRGTGLLGTDCPRGQFLHFDRNCYGCPSGYTRTANAITAGNACSMSIRGASSPAEYQGPFFTAYNPGNIIYQQLVPFLLGRANVQPPVAANRAILMVTGNFLRSPGWHLSGHDRMFIDHTLANSMKELRAWLKGHPGETVILRIRASDYRAKQQSFKSEIVDNLGIDVIYTPGTGKLNPADATLNATKGKAILLWDKPQDDTFWNLRQPWFASTGYRGDGDGDIEKYKTYLNSVVDRDTAKLTFFTTELTPYGSDYSGPQDPYSLVKKWHPTLERLITSDWKNKSLNIVAIDFIGNFNNIERHVVLLNK